MNASEFDRVVLTGGGDRCWWQAGWWDVVQPELGPAPHVIADTSAGASTTYTLHVWDSVELMDYYGGTPRQNTYNVHQGSLLRGERVFPRYGMYRMVLLTVFSEDHFGRLMQASETRIGVVYILHWLGARSTVAAGLVVYDVKRYVRRTLHPALGKRLGSTAEIVCVQDCVTLEGLAGLLLQSTSTPPLTSVLRYTGQLVFDGDMVDNMPVHASDATPNDALVLVMRLYPHPTYSRMDVPVPDDVQRRFYVQPSHKVPISNWDYIRPGAMRDAYALGRHDGETLLRELLHGFTTAVAA